MSSFLLSIFTLYLVTFASPVLADDDDESDVTGFILGIIIYNIVKGVAFLIIEIFICLEAYPFFQMLFASSIVTGMIYIILLPKPETDDYDYDYDYSHRNSSVDAGIFSAFAIDIFLSD